MPQSSSVPHMRAAVFYGQRDVRVEEVTAVELAPTHVRLRVEAAGVCGSDLHVFRGEDPWQTCTFPTRGGHELAGTVVEVGEGVTRCRPGDRVAVRPSFLTGCGECVDCGAGHGHRCLFKDSVEERPISAGFAEQAIAHELDVFAVPQAMPLASASIADVVACGLHAIRGVGVHRGETVAVVGTGAIGVAVASTARAVAGASVVVVGRSPASAKRAATAAGCDTWATDANGVLDVTAGRGADVVVEAVGGSGSAVPTVLAAAAPGARVVIAGSFWQRVELDYEVANRKELAVKFSCAHGDRNGHAEFEESIELMAAGVIDAESWITHRLPLDAIEDAFHLAEAKAANAALKVLVSPNE